MAFLIFNGPFDYYSGEDFGFNYVSDISGTPDTWTVRQAATQQYRTYQLNTTGIGALELIPDPSVSYSSYGSGVNGVATYLTFTPSGSIRGPSIKVVEETGVFAYSYDFALASTQFVNDINAHASRGDNVVDVYINFVKEINLLQSPGFSAAQDVANYFHANASSLAVQAGGVFADLARDAQNFERVANEWATPVYFLDTGSGYNQISSSAIDFGIDLTTVNGAKATWAVNGTAGSVTVTGFTVVGHYSGDPNYPSTGSHGYYDFVPAEMNGWLDVSSFIAAHKQTISASTLAAQGVTTNFPVITQYVLWETGSGGAKLAVNGVLQANQQNIVLTPAQFAQATYTSGSGSDTLWFKLFDGGQSSEWKSVVITGPIDTGPVETVSNRSVSHGQSLAAASLFTYSDPFGDAATNYDLWNAGTGGGHFVLNGSALNPGQDNIITAAQLAQLSYQSGSGTDTLWVRANDGLVWGPWSQPFTVTAPINHAPNISASDVSPSKSMTTLAAASLFSVTDTDNDTIVKYQLWDSTSDLTSGHWSVGGVAKATNVAIDVTPAQLTQTAFILGTSGSDDLWARANDGVTWSDWKEFHVSAPVNHAPTVISFDFVAAHNQILAATALFGAYDADNDSITKYQFWDSTSDPASGHWSVGGVAKGTNVGIEVAAAQLANTTFQTGFVADDLWVRANDGTAWGEWIEFHSLPVPNHTPIANTLNFTAAHKQSIAASALFSVSDADGDTIAKYQFWDSTADAASGHWVVGGLVQGTGVAIDITAAQLAGTTFQSGSGSDDLWVRANDGFEWGAWKEFHVNAPVDHAPIVAASNFNAAPNQIVAAASLFAITDADNDIIAKYQFWDSTTNASSGHWTVGGVSQGTNLAIDVTAAQLASTTFHGGSQSDDLWVRANDGIQWSAWQEFHWIV